MTNREKSHITPILDLKGKCMNLEIIPANSVIRSVVAGPWQWQLSFKCTNLSQARDRSHELRSKYNLGASDQKSVGFGKFRTQQQTAATLKMTELHIHACFRISAPPVALGKRTPNNKPPTELTSWRLYCGWAFQIDLTAYVEELFQLAAGAEPDSPAPSAKHSPENCQKLLLL